MENHTATGRTSLTAAERLLLLNQFAILERLYPALQREFAVKREIVERGEVEHYDVLFVSPVTPAGHHEAAARQPTRAAADRGGALTPW